MLSFLTKKDDNAAAKVTQHFDHNFKGELHTCDGPVIEKVFGAMKGAKRPIVVVCTQATMNIIDNVAKKRADLPYQRIIAMAWDHTVSEVKVTFRSSSDESENGLILTLTNSIEFEAEMKLRFTTMLSTVPDSKLPSTLYYGVFAGATKPKPFQRQRPNLSHLPQGKLPTLHQMRHMATDLHVGSYKPCPQTASRRLEIAFQHIYDGSNAFFLTALRGPSAIANQWNRDSILGINDEALVFRPRGIQSDTKIEFSYAEISEWTIIDNEKTRATDSGIEVHGKNGEKIFFGVEFVRDVKHTLEYFWNKHKIAQNEPPKMGSTHGRPIVSLATLSGEIPPLPTSELGASTEIVDMDGRPVRSNGMLISRTQRGEPFPVPPPNFSVQPHWKHVVLHQGWMLKQGGVGVGSAKSWIKRYFVLYKTSQGHFLVYYSDLTDSPYYSQEKNHRNVVDMAKVAYIRPGSNKQDNLDTPSHSFDIVTTEREWTLCAESKENVQRWMKILTRAVDEDVAIMPDEELVFKVKPKVDPLGILPSTDYTTSFKLSGHGVAISTPVKDREGYEEEHYFWVYTDFYKWTLLSQSGKLALLVNVFADAQFNRRIEYIFRHKDAQRMATALEFFIEKFMCVMHIRLEATESATALAGYESGANSAHTSANYTGARLHQLSAADEQEQAQEVDLLDLNVMGELTINSASSAPTVATGGDPFNDPFGGAFSAPPPIPVAAPPAVPHSAPPAGSIQASVLQEEEDDVPSVAPPAIPAHDPFAELVEPAVPATTEEQVSFTPAAALTAEEIAQHRQWCLSAISSAGGPLYDDGNLQVAVRLETRGSQSRLSFMYINQQATGSIVNLAVEIKDEGGLMRYELGQLASTEIPAGERITQIMMLECVKPAAQSPQIVISYAETVTHTQRTETLDLPLILNTFNEPLTVTAEEFSTTWQSLVAPGQEAQEVLKPTYPVVPTQIYGVLTSMLKFARIEGLPDATEFVIYGAATLRTGAIGQNGEKVSVPCLAKIEMNVQSNAMRITFRSVHGSVAQATLATVKKLLL